MLDGLLGRGGFSSKCKSLMKVTKTRIDVIRRKRNAAQRFLRKDIADLISNGLDVNAYGRAEGLLVEVITSSCYDFVERCCDLVLQTLSIMQKQSECPDECKAAVASLMLAAARFSDLPELRDLRQMFYERYGDSLALFEDEVFKENLASTPSTLEKKVRLLKEIASEFSIKWDYKAFEQRMNKPPVPPQDPRKAHRDFHLGPDKSKPSHGKDKVINGDGPGNLLRERFGRPRNDNDGSVLKVEATGDFRTRHEVSSNGRDKPVTVWDEPPVKKKDTYENSLLERKNFYPDRQAQEAPNLKQDATPRSVRSGGSFNRKIEPVDVGSKMLYGRENNAPIIGSRDALPYPKVAAIDSQDVLPSANPEIAISHAKRNGKEKLPVKDETAPKPKSYKNMVIPPPYVKHFDKAKVRKHDAHLGSDGSSDRNGIPKDHHGSDHLDGPERADIHQDETANPVPKPRSSRRRHSRSRSFHNEAANFEEPAPVLPRKSKSKRKEDPRRGLQVLFDDEHHQKDDEERIIDKLLMHYSKKPTSGVPDPVRPRRSSRSRHAHRDQNGSGDRSDKEPSPQTSRSFSLPREHSGPSSATKVLSRAATFQLDRSDGARHVHPKLPNYDDLAAQFAALRGR